jgi:murein DD-endopeptidase MepM/ murein hydrolase activator NlpD
VTATVSTVVRALVASAALVLLGAPAANAQHLYKYRDENGVWVFTDRQPAANQPYEQTAIERRFEPPEVRLYQQATENGIGLVAQNTFYAPIQLAFRLSQTENVAAGTPLEGLKVVPARSSMPLVLVGKATPNADLRFETEFQFLPGEPGAEHRPPQPYRFPYALSTSAWVSQAFPDTTTHGDPASQYAIDFVMPVGTHVFAAREGVVIEVASDFFENGTDLKADGPRANIVRVLHDDGTMSLYGHLSWNSIRVVPGQHVARGEYLADSGNTGFSTGPHLHFVVQRNRGGALVSVPIEFVSVGGVPVTVRSHDRYTAY